MSEELESKILNLINGAENNIPELAQEYLSWHLTSNIMMLIIGIICLIILGFLGKKYGTDYFEMETPLLLISSIVLFVVGVVFVIIPPIEIVKIKTAPKVFLIDSLRSK